MYSDLECGICYRTYNLGRRCPRELHCRHSFCESCLLALSRAPEPPQPGAADRSIVCPLCRQTTSISGGERKIRADLRVDESVMERLLAAGVLDQEEEEDEEEPEEVEADGQVQDACDDDDEDQDQSAGRDESPAEQSDSSAGTGGGKLRRTLKKVWRKIIGDNSRQRNDCMTSDDLRNFAMMSCHMF